LVGGDLEGIMIVHSLIMLRRPSPGAFAFQGYLNQTRKQAIVNGFASFHPWDDVLAGELCYTLL
jgi:hypothetical protein